jgi:adenine/guanine phosphoribosyltransferase-like PRPP-binding protein
MNDAFDPKNFKRFDFRIACAFWLNELLQSPKRLRDLLETAESSIRADVGDDFHFFAVTGVSGIVLGTLLSQKFERHLVVVRKQREAKHSGYIVEGLQAINGVGNLKYVIVDDFISTGTTIKRMRYELSRHARGSELVGAYLYNDCGFRPAQDLPIFSTTEQQKYEESRLEG